MNIKSIDTEKAPKRGLTAAVLAALAASVCCVGPLVLIGLGIGGAWVSNLTALEPFRPYFMGLTFILLGYAFYRIYRKPKAEECEPGSYCANPKSDRINKISLWTVTAFVLVLFAVPYIAGYSASTPDESGASAFEIGDVQKAMLDVPGMTCASCPATVKAALTKVPGVLKAEVSFEKKKAVVLFDASKASPQDLVEATTNAGYPSTVSKNEQE